MSHSLFLCLLLVIPALAVADETADSSIAVLNVDKVFKAYPQLQERMVPLKQRAAELDKSAQLRQVEIETTQAKIRGLKPGTPEFDNQQVILAKLQTELRLFVERERNNLRKSEVEIYVAVYHEMEVAVKELCQERRIKLVVRQNEGSDKGDNVDEIMKWLNRPVIFAENLDITEDVIERMKNAKKGEEDK